MPSSISNPKAVAETSARRELPFAPGSLRQVGAVAILLLLAVSQIGCAPFRGLRETIAYNDAVNDFVMGWRNSTWARQAWHERKWMYIDQPQFVTFGQGFRDGYAAVAAGSDGCVPALPPRHYWSWKFQTGEGQAKVAAWFAGYPHGVQAAQEDGAGHFQQIQVSHIIEAEYSPEFRAGKCPDCSPSYSTGNLFEIIPEGLPTEAPADPDPAPMSTDPQSIIDPTSQRFPVRRGPREREPTEWTSSPMGTGFAAVTKSSPVPVHELSPRRPW
jgi:hypothetical protein